MAMAAEANAVTLKLPTFWPAHPDVWFAQAEAQFQIRGITSDLTKFHYVVAALDQDAASQLLDVIRSPPENDKYTTLKTSLLRTFGLSRRARAAKLLDLRRLGDRKPVICGIDSRSPTRTSGIILHIHDCRSSDSVHIR